MKNGPLSNRRCSDCLFTILFLAFLGLVGYIMIEAVENGDPQKLINPVDYDGKLCGIDNKDYDYLYYIVQVSTNSVS